jgi:hypothetical protein
MFKKIRQTENETIFQWGGCNVPPPGVRVRKKRAGADRAKPVILDVK